MKNLKRVLSLGLASVMLLGMMVVGASAKDFTDAEDIINKEAVQVMVALGVINGKEDGSYYAPKDNVSRAEMAKMITVILMGGNDVKTGVKGTPTFTDIANNWAEDYIEYCADTGIISGRGDGTFNPDGDVTVLEATKMALTAMGYNQDAYRLTGAAWAGMTAETARTMPGVKLFDGLEASNAILNAPASRDVAAQILWNALQGWVVLYEPDRNTNSGEVSWRYVVKEGTSLLNQRYDATVSTGTFDGNADYNMSGTTLADGEIRVKVPTVTSTGTPGTPADYDFPSDFSIDNIGEEVKIVWKDNKVKGTIGTLEKNDTVYGVFVTGATRVVRSQLSKVQSNNTSKSTLKIDGNVYSTEDSVTVVTNYGNNTLATDDSSASSSNKPATVSTSMDATNGTPGSTTVNGTSNDLTRLLKKSSGNKFKAVFNGDGKIETIYLVEDYVDTVAAINSSRVTLSNFGSLTIADHNIAEDLKVGDVVAVTPLYCDDSVTNPVTQARNNTATFTVKKAEVVSGEITAWKDDEKLMLDDKEYKLNYKNSVGNSSVTESHGTALGLLDNIPELPAGHKVISTVKDSTNSYIGETFDLYLINGYVVAAVQTSKGASNYSLITEIKGTSATGSVFNRLQLQVMNAEGELDIITVSRDSVRTNSDLPTAITVRDDRDTAITSKDYSVGDIITYTFDEDDEAVVTVVGQAAAGSLTYNDSAKTLEGKATTADCVLFVQTAADVNITPESEFIKATGAEPEWDAYDLRTLEHFDVTADAVTVAYNKDNKIVAAFMNKKSDPEGAASDRVYALVKSYNRRVKDYYEYTVVSNGESWEILVKANTIAATVISERDIITFKRTADDIYTPNRLHKLQYNTAADGIGDGTTPNTYVGYVKDYNSKDNTLTYYTQLQLKSGSTINEGVPAAQRTYALDKDCVVLYVDLEAKTSDGGAIAPFDPTTVRANAMMVLDGTPDSATDPVVVKVLVVNSGLTRRLPGVSAERGYPDYDF